MGPNTVRGKSLLQSLRTLEFIAQICNDDFDARRDRHGGVYQNEYQMLSDLYAYRRSRNVFEFLDRRLQDARARVRTIDPASLAEAEVTRDRLLDQLKLFGSFLEQEVGGPAAVPFLM